jgi:hypothetical protein
MNRVSLNPNIFRKSLFSHSPPYKLDDIHDLDGNFISFDIGSHGAHTLLAGSDNRLGTGPLGLFNLAFGNFCRQLGVNHLQVSASAAAITIFPVVGQLNQLNTGYRLDYFPGGIKYPGAPA